MDFIATIENFLSHKSNPPFLQISTQMFWNNFGKYLKVGIIEDDRNRKEIAEYLRFFSASSGEEYTSLKEYVEKMPENQKAIYYVTGEGKERAAMSPVAEKLKGKGFDVLYATEPLDEIMFESLTSFGDYDIKDAGKDTLKLDDDDEDTVEGEEVVEEAAEEEEEEEATQQPEPAAVADPAKKKKKKKKKHNDE